MNFRHGTICGSPGYIAREVISRQKQTPALDCFSLGVILHRSCVGRTPFELPDGHVSDEYVTKCKYSPPVSMNLSVREVTTNLIKKSPSERWTAKQVCVQKFTCVQKYFFETQTFRCCTASWLPTSSTSENTICKNL